MGSDQAKPRAFDLFSGCGGLSLGLKRAGFDVIGAIEKDKLAASTYKKNHAGTRLLRRDIRWLPAKQVMETFRLKPGQLDLLAGCPPCQGFSAVRTLNGKRRAVGHGSNMVYEFLRFVRAMRPKTVMLENVPGLSKNWRLNDVRRRLESMGYSVTSAVLDASDYGTPQRRRRLILLASVVGTPEFATAALRQWTVRDAIGGLPKAGASGDWCHDAPERRTAKVRAMIEQIPKNGGSRDVLKGKHRLQCHRKFNGFNDVYGRMSWDDVAPTITGGCVNPSKGRFLHPQHNRTITLREAALLQGFPRRYFFSLEGGKFRAAEMIGNAFPPAFVTPHARRLRRQILQAGLKHSGA